VIILVRHGQTTTNEKGLLVGRSDPELTDLGERQALALKPLLGDVREVWATSLRRARRTAALAVPHLEATINDAFIEVDYGSLDGQPLNVVSAEQWRAFESDHATALGDDGESLATVDARVHEALDALLADESSLLHSHRHHLVIVSHVSPIKSAMVWALGVPGSVAWRTRLDNGSITTISVRQSTPALVHFNMVPALD
jgi:probable phosphoglycerate mutase